MRTRATMLRKCSALFAVLSLLALSGCLVVGSTEHRITLNQDESGEGVLRLIDIRSDATTDSAVARDLEIMMSAYNQDAEKEFAQEGRTITSKRFIIHSDTLIGELTYTFASLTALAGMRVTDDELYVVVGPTREIVRTNGKIRSDDYFGKQIAWERAAQRLLYHIREKTIPRSVSLAAMYAKSMQ